MTAGENGSGVRPGSAVIAPAMTEAAGVAPLPEWQGAMWVGAIDDSLDPSTVHLEGAETFTRARLLVRTGAMPRGFVEVALHDGQVDPAELQAAIQALPPAATARPEWDVLPPISVVICTFNRPDSLRRALQSVTKVDYPDFEILVVDNNPLSRTVMPVVEEVGDPRIRVVTEPTAGLCRARNTGLLAARHEYIAFTDDDVVVDPHWLRGIAAGFAAAPDVACVTGMVPSGALLTPVHLYFDQRVSWAALMDVDLYRADQERPDLPMFPFCVGRYGTGANFAFRRADLFALGGFDQALGGGTHTGGGDDIDMFLRILLSGRALAYEPSSIVWHRHRDDSTGLGDQIYTYGTGLGAVMTMYAIRPKSAWRLAKVSLSGARHIWTKTDVSAKGVVFEGSDALTARERRGVVAGPYTLMRDRLAGARRYPLRGVSADRGDGSPAR